MPWNPKQLAPVAAATSCSGERRALNGRKRNCVEPADGERVQGPSARASYSRDLKSFVEDIANAAKAWVIVEAQLAPGPSIAGEAITLRNIQ